MVTMQHQQIEIVSADAYGDRPPIDLCSKLFGKLSPMIQDSVRMAFEGTSRIRGVRPRWLTQATDVRLVDIDGSECTTILHCEAPMLGVAAPDLYEQTELFPTKPPAESTALNVTADMLADLEDPDTDSNRYDRALLQDVSDFKKLFERRHMQAIRLPSGSAHRNHRGTVTGETIERATSLSDRTPPPQHTRIVGKLDMIRHSTQAFELALEDDQRVRGVYTAGSAKALAEHLGHDVMVIGQAIFRPSGSLLRIDAQAVEAAKGQVALWQQVPTSNHSQLPTQRRKTSTGKQRAGVAAFFGIWPGDESDHDLQAMLQDLR